MNAKLKVDLKQGIVEVEGTEEFVAKIYDDYKERLAVMSSQPNQSPAPPNNRTTPTPEEKKRNPKGRNHAGSPPSIAKDLNLAALNGQPSLKDFCAPYEPGNAKEWNLLFLYFLQKNNRVSPVTLDHIYTCYKTSGAKPPTAFGQSIFDTGSKKGWLESNGLIDIKLTIAGENYVDHDFPKKQQAK